jgi:hypothetical protein
MDAKADHRLAAWPTEGASLVEAIERISGPELLAECRTARAAIPLWIFEKVRGWRPRGWLDESGKYQPREAGVMLATRAEESMHACLTPVIDAWNAGEIRATGKRRDVLTDAVKIPAPTNLWVLSGVDLEHSIIDDPAGGKIFDLRFHIGEPRPPMTTRRWLESAVTERRRAGNIPEKPTDFARSLRRQMIADKNHGLVESVLDVRTIVNYLRKL